MLTLISETELDGFRATWSGGEILRLLPQHGGKILISWPVGIGKSFNIDDVVEVAVPGETYDLVVVLCPTRQVVSERRWVLHPPSDVSVTVLRPRPVEKCGYQRNEQWQSFEQRGLGLLGRERICGCCPRRRRCFWPEQYGKQLADYQVIYGTQSHLERDPSFIWNLKRWAGAARVLLILDEDKAIVGNRTATITQQQLATFATVAEKLATKLPDHRVLRRLADLCRALQRQHRSEDLRCGEWKFPRLIPELIRELHVHGEESSPGTFEDLHFKLISFGRSSFESREIMHGNIKFATAPQTPADMIVYSGTASPELLSFRLGQELASPFRDYRFHHSLSKWYNLASRLGARCNFVANSPQILDFFAGLAAKRMREGLRVLFVCKKCHLKRCAEGVAIRLRELGFQRIKVVTGNWHEHDLQDPHIVPIITFGIVGTNLFEHFDAAYCLNAFNVSENEINTALQDMRASDHAVPLKIVTEGIPLRRSVVVNEFYRRSDVGKLANDVLRMREMDTVVQAVGRVRPFTKPREVITFQAADLPYGPYEREFVTLAEARSFFGIPSRRDQDKAITAADIAAAKATKMTQKSVAKSLGVSIRTVKRYWHSEGATSPVKDNSKASCHLGGGA